MKTTTSRLLLLMFLLAACTKAEPVTKTVTFSIGNIRSGELGTKGTPASILSVTAPTGTPALTVASTTNKVRTYTATPGTPVSLPCDTYHVTGRYIPTKTADILRGAAYQEPRYRLDAQLTITDGQDSYAVPAQYECFAVIADLAEIDHYTHSDPNASQVEMPYKVSDGFGVLYVYCNSAWTSSYCYRITAYPTDTAEHEARQYALITSGTGGVLVENGKWYAFCAAEVDKQSGNIGTSLPEWEAGTI